MGLIRKSLAISTVGIVKGSSKKQRVAKATQRGIEQSNRIAAAQAKDDHEFRYATDLVYREYMDRKEAERLAIPRWRRQPR
jgi:hypothetical protein